MKRFPGRLALLIVLYTIIAAAAIYPASISPSERIVGGGELGGWLWRYWWMKLEVKALAVEMASHPLQLFLHIISLGRFPETGNIADLYLLSLPLDALFGHPTYYNFKCMFIVITNGLAGYALSRQFTKSPWLAFAGGAVLAMNSLVALEFFGSGLRQAILSPAAMAVLSFERLWARGRIRDGVATGVWFALVAGFYWFYGLFLFLYAVGRTVVAIPGWWRSEKRVWTFAVLLQAALIGAGLAAVFAYPYIMFKLDHTGQLPEVQYLTDFPSLATLQEATDHPRTLEENLMASLKRVLQSSWRLDYLWNPSHPRNVTLAVFVVGVLGAALRIRRAWFWLLAMAFFWIHTGGPYLMEMHNSGERIFTEQGGEPIRLLYAYTFKYVPLMSRLFAPYRAAGFLWVMLTVLCVIGLDSLRGMITGGFRSLGPLVPAPYAGPERAPELPEGDENAPPPPRTSGWKAAVSPTLAVVFLGLFFGQQFGDDWLLQRINPKLAGTIGRGLPVYNSEVQTHPFYHALAKEEGHIGVVELPMAVQQDLITFYQTVHKKKVLEGWAEPGALPPYLRFVREPKSETTELLQFLSSPDTTGPNSFIDSMKNLSNPPYKLQDFDDADLASLAGRGFRYVILHERGCYLLWSNRGSELYQALKRRLAAKLGTPAQVIEVVERGDPQLELLRPHTGLLGSWASSALPMADGAAPPTRFHMAVFLIPDGGWGEGWLEAVAWPDRLREAPAHAASPAGGPEASPVEEATAAPAHAASPAGGPEASPVEEATAAPAHAASPAGGATAAPSP